MYHHSITELSLLLPLLLLLLLQLWWCCGAAKHCSTGGLVSLQDSAAD
jgi:hypothetical protein